MMDLFVQDGDTVLMKAVLNNRADIVELLLKAGADVNVKNIDIAHVISFLLRDSISSF